MTLLSPPLKPLKILTIDGGGLQAIAPLLLLDDLLESIRVENGAAEKPRPCEVFDVIAGIGSGGWLALLLGRFCLDIPTCLLEWSQLMGVIAPHSILHGEKRQLLSGSLFKREPLMEQVRHLTEMYATGDKLIEEDLVPRVRSRYVFVAALQDDKKQQYNLFRTYRVPQDAPKLLKGPKNPEEYTIWDAFGVTGAAKYFSPAWKEDIAGEGRRRFLDRTVPQPHNITELALREVWSIFPRDVRLDVIINIGPGLVSQHDFRQISRSFTWPPNPARWVNRPRAHEVQNSLTCPPRRMDTQGSFTDMTPSRKAARTEEQIESDIRSKLEGRYGADAPPYYRLAPPTSAIGAYANDTRRVKSIEGSTTEYLNNEDTRNIYQMAGPRWRGEYTGTPTT